MALVTVTYGMPASLALTDNERRKSPIHQVGVPFTQYSKVLIYVRAKLRSRIEWSRRLPVDREIRCS